MPEEKLTTVQIDTETRDKLKLLAQAYERTQAGQLRWMVNLEFDKLEKVKLLPKAEVKKTKRQAQKVE